MNRKTRPEEISDSVLDDVSGGPEYLAPGVFVEEVSFATAHAGLRSDGELVQAVSEPKRSR